MKICEFLQCFLSCTGRVIPATKGTDGTDRGCHSRKPPDPGDLQHRPAGLHTAQNVLTTALRTLSSVSSNIPFGSILSSVIDPLLDITDRIQQVSTNAQGLTELAARIELLTPIVSDIATNKPEEGRAIVEALKRELEVITKDLSDARAQGKLEQFFNSTDNASSLTKHNITLAQMIADSTVGRQPLSYPRLSRICSLLPSRLFSKLCKTSNALSSRNHGFPKAGFLPGLCRGLGGMGGSGRLGGEGGEGEGPELEMTLDENWKVGDIFGGTGGTGGAGIDVGGKGGSGKAPIIRALRRNPAVIVPQQAKE
ncbi:hypothetical protein FB451DRAFT_1373144 [Mycena latifolia]|nr:hypothetical protein FB451DRAFT_1373144 [Mycena latifolia]